MSFENIQKAFNSTIKAAETSLGVPVIVDQVSYKPDNEQMYINCFMLPAPVTQAELGTGGVGSDFHSGIFQVDINDHMNNGTTGLNRKADEVNAVIKSADTLVWQDCSVRIQNVSISAIRTDSGRAILSVSISWFTHKIR